MRIVNYVLICEGMIPKLDKCIEEGENKFTFILVSFLLEDPDPGKIVIIPQKLQVQVVLCL